MFERRHVFSAGDHGFDLRHALGRVELLAAFDQLFFRSDGARLNAGAEFLEIVLWVGGFRAASTQPCGWLAWGIAIAQKRMVTE